MPGATNPGARTASNARESYFFGKGQRELAAAIKAAWSSNLAEGRSDWSKARRAWQNAEFKRLDYGKAVFLGASAAAVVAVGSLVIAALASIHIAVLTLVFGAVYLTYALVWTVERVYLTVRGFFLVCPDCGERVALPLYICPKCGREHDALMPSSYGVLFHKCVCGKALPATFFNGRESLDARCPHDGAILDPLYRASAKRLVAVAGPVSAGKSMLLFAAAHEIIEGLSKVIPAPAEPYGERSKTIYGYYESTVIRSRLTLPKTPEMTPQAFMILLEKRSPPELLYFYDPSGEAFRDEEKLKSHRYLPSLSGIVFVLDPFSLPVLSRALRNRMSTNPALRSQINPSADAPVDALSRLARGIELAHDSEQGASITAPIAVTLSKIDALGLEREVGPAAIAAAQRSDEPLHATRDRVIRDKIIAWEGADVVALLEARFRRRAFFATSVIPAWARPPASGKPGVLDPFEWVYAQGRS